MNGLLVGRFQPFHSGHLEAIRFALRQVEMLWIGIGSSNRCGEADNPFSAGERMEMILSSLEAYEIERVSVYPIPDVDDHSRWVELVEQTVPEFGVIFSRDPMTGSLFYSRNVRVAQAPFLDRHVLSGVNIRRMMRAGEDWRPLVPDGSRRVLERIGAASRLDRL